MASGGANLGSAYITIMPTMGGSVNKIISMLGGIGTSGTKIGSNFGSTFSKKASSAMSVFAVTAGNLVASGISASMSAIGASLNSAVSRYDTLNNFPKVMQNLGISSTEAQKAINKMSDGLTGLPTTLDAGASAVQRFTSVNNDVNKSTDMFLALNNAILAGGQSTQIQESALEQLSQAYSKGKMDMMEWRTLQMAMPAQLNQVAKAMGMSTDELGEGLRGGTVSMDDFMNKIVELNETGVGEFASFTEQAKSSVGGIGTAMTVFKTQITKSVTACIDGVDKMLTGSGLLSIGGYISTAADEIKKFGNNVGASIAAIDLSEFVSKFNGTVSLIKQATSQYIEPFKDSVRGIKDAFVDMANTAYPIIQDLAVRFAPIAVQVGEVIAQIISAVIRFVTRVMQLIQPLMPVIQTVLTVAVEGINKFLQATSGLDPVAQMVLVLAGAFGVLGAKLGIAYILKYAAAWIRLGGTFNRIKGAVGGVAGKLTSVIPSLKSTDKAMKKTSTTASSSATKMLKYAAAVALLGASVALIAVGFSLLAQSCIALATAGTPAMVMMGVMMVGIIALVAVIGMVAPALSVASAGMLALGAMVLMVCAGLSLLILTIATFTPQLIQLITTLTVSILAIITGVTLAIVVCVQTIGNTIVAIVNAVAGAITQIISAVVYGIVAIISTIAQSVALIVSSVASGIQTVVMSVGTAICMIVQTVGEAISLVVTSTAQGINTVCAGIEGVVRGIGDAISGIFTSIFTGIADVINSIFDGIQTCGWAIETIAEKAWDASAGMAAFTATCTGCAWMLGDCAGKMGTLGSSMNTCSTALNNGCSSMSRISSATQALSAVVMASTSAWDNYANRVNSIMSNVVSNVQNKMNQLRSAVNNARLEATVRVSVGKLPHFRMNGKFDAESGQVPTISVDWYKRGGVFTSPSIIGVGEAGNEAVLPLNSRTYGEIADGISNNSKDASLIDWLSANLGTIINQNAPATVIDNDAGSLIVDNRLQQLQRKAGMNRGYYTGVLSTTGV